MSKSGLADSPFFAKPTNEVAPPPPVLTPIDIVADEHLSEKPSKKSNPLHLSKPKTATKPQQRDTVIPSNHATVVSRHHDTMVSSNHDTTIEIVRKAVKEMGKEAATHRFTVDEKRAVLDLIYSYKGLGLKTSENEVARIAINYILEDYKQNGRNSILDKVLKALNE
ncbi:MAG: hypothetical protein JNM46_00335 [Anaerolineales bacterium]|nr:hypothetical protein [Anaerolineales bacterium]